MTPNNCTEFFAHISQNDTHYIIPFFWLFRKEREKKACKNILFQRGKRSKRDVTADHTKNGEGEGGQEVTSAPISVVIKRTPGAPEAPDLCAYT